MRPKRKAATATKSACTGACCLPSTSTGASSANNPKTHQTPLPKKVSDSGVQTSPILGESDIGSDDQNLNIDPREMFPSIRGRKRTREELKSDSDSSDVLIRHKQRRKDKKKSKHRHGRRQKQKQRRVIVETDSSDSSDSDSLSSDDEFDLLDRHSRQFTDSRFPGESPNGRQGSHPYTRGTIGSDLTHVIVTLLEGSLAPSTRKAYTAAFSHYKSFHLRYYGYSPSGSISCKKLTAFIAYCHTAGMKYSTISARLLKP